MRVEGAVQCLSLGMSDLKKSLDKEMEERRHECAALEIRIGNKIMTERKRSRWSSRG